MFDCIHLHHVTNSVLVKPLFALELGLGGMKHSWEVIWILFHPSTNFRTKKRVLLKFSLCAECFTMQCCNLIAKNSRHKLYFPCCVRGYSTDFLYFSKLRMPKITNLETDMHKITIVENNVNHKVTVQYHLEISHFHNAVPS